MKKAVKGLASIIEWIGGIAILVMTLVVLLNVIMRYVFSYSLTWTEEFARYLFIYITFLGAGLLTYERGHLFVEIIFNNLPHKTKKIVQLIIDAIVFGFAVYLVPSALTTMKVASGSFSTAMHIPMEYISMSVLFGALLIAIFALWNVVQDVKGMKEGGEEAC